MKKLGLSLGFAFILLGCFCAFMNTGCDMQPIPIPIREYATTNSPPSRYKVVSIDYYKVEGVVPNFSVVVLSDTEGTNDYMFVGSGSGLSTPIIVPKPVKQVEDWRTK